MPPKSDEEDDEGCDGECVGRSLVLNLVLSLVANGEMELAQNGRSKNGSSWIFLVALLEGILFFLLHRLK